MHIVYEDEENIYITGGVSFTQNKDKEEKISDKAYLYNPKKNTVKELPKMT